MPKVPRLPIRAPILVTTVSTINLSVADVFLGQAFSSHVATKLVFTIAGRTSVLWKDQLTILICPCKVKEILVRLDFIARLSVALILQHGFFSSPSVPSLQSVVPSHFLDASTQYPFPHWNLRGGLHSQSRSSVLSGQSRIKSHLSNSLTFVKWWYSTSNRFQLRI